MHPGGIGFGAVFGRGSQGPIYRFDSALPQLRCPMRPYPPATICGPENNRPLTHKALHQLSLQEDRAAEQVRQQEKQRIAGVVPNFNVSYNADAAPLSQKQKLHIALRTAIDPVSFGIAGFDAGFSQAENDFPGYGQGAQGYAKRFGASYADNFDGTLLGNAIFPILLKQDPRYFRRGTGSFSSRLFYSLSTTVWSKSDNGKWGPNYSNVLGNLAAGGISNLYYPASDRGAGLTFERGFTVTAYGAFGGVFNEFWPDIAKKIFKDKMAKLQPKVPPATTPVSFSHRRQPPLEPASPQPASLQIHDHDASIRLKAPAGRRLCRGEGIRGHHIRSARQNPGSREALLQKVALLVDIGVDVMRHSAIALVFLKTIIVSG